VLTESEGALQKARAAFDAGDYLAVIEQARATSTRLGELARDLETAASAPKPAPRRRR
jgi:hypothetical protein